MGDRMAKIADILMRTAKRPVHERVYVESMLGRKKPITENDFSPSEMQRLQDTIETARSNRERYGVKRAERDAFNRGYGTIRANDYIANQYETHPKKYPAGEDPIFNTIGTSRYEPSPVDGSRRVIDNYDWNNQYDDKMRERFKGMNAVEKAAYILNDAKGQLSPYSQRTAENIATAYAPNASIPINIQVPAVNKEPFPQRALKPAWRP